MKRIIAVFLCAVMAFSCLTGCMSANAEDLMKGVTAKDTDGSFSEADADVISDFSLRLFKNCAGDGAVISPLSVLYALAMTANGAGGETLAQMEEVLGAEISKLNPALKYCTGTLGEELKCANSIWYNDASVFTPDAGFLQTNADYYGAGLFRLPFDDAALRQINKWVEDNTDGMIKDMLDSIPSEAVMYLINALSFDAKWQDKFDKDLSTDGIFTAANGEKQNVRFMHSNEHRYIDDDNAKGFMKYYEGGKYAFMALLPDEGVSTDEYIASLTAQKLRSFISGTSTGVLVNVAMPEFEADFSLELSDILKSMGMVDAFDGDIADFSPMGDCKEKTLYIGRVIHKAHIEVSETGTKAGASTAVEMRCESAMIGETVSVELDRPFVYMIVDTNSCIPVFMGTCSSIV